MGSLSAKHCRHRGVRCLLTIGFRWAGFYLERSRQSAAKEIPAFKKCKRSHRGNLTALLCGGVFITAQVCVCVSWSSFVSQVSLLSWNTKVPPPFHVGVRYCGGLILASQWPCSLGELQSFIYRSDSTWPSLCASWPFFSFFFRERES